MKTTMFSPATVIALIALVIALGGTSWAALKLPKNSVGTKQIKNGGVRTSDLRKNSVTRAKIAPGAVSPSDIAAGSIGGTKVADNSLTGADILESSLGTVPSAGTAGTAGSVTGRVKFRVLSRTADPVADATQAPYFTIGQAGGFTIQGRCWRNTGNNAILANTYALTTEPGTVAYNPGQANPQVTQAAGDRVFALTSAPQIGPGNLQLVGTAQSLLAPSGNNVAFSVTIGINNTNAGNSAGAKLAFGGTGKCSFVGLAEVY